MKHSAVATLWFDVAAEHSSQAFDVVLMTETREGMGWIALRSCQTRRRRLVQWLLLIAQVEDDSRYLRIGQASIIDINFYLGCQEEVVEII